jgi:hypothetical protein
VLSIDAVSRLRLVPATSADLLAASDDRAAPRLAHIVLEAAAAKPTAHVLLMTGDSDERTAEWHAAMAAILEAEAGPAPPLAPPPRVAPDHEADEAEPGLAAPLLAPLPWTRRFRSQILDFPLDEHADGVNATLPRRPLAPAVTAPSASCRTVPLQEPSSPQPVSSSASLPQSQRHYTAPAAVDSVPSLVECPDIDEFHGSWGLVADSLLRSWIAQDQSAVPVSPSAAGGDARAGEAAEEPVESAEPAPAPLAPRLAVSKSATTIDRRSASPLSGVTSPITPSRATYSPVSESADGSSGYAFSFASGPAVPPASLASESLATGTTSSSRDSSMRFGFALGASSPVPAPSLASGQGSGVVGSLGSVLAAGLRARLGSGVSASGDGPEQLLSTGECGVERRPSGDSYAAESAAVQPSSNGDHGPCDHAHEEVSLVDWSALPRVTIEMLCSRGFLAVGGDAQRGPLAGASDPYALFDGVSMALFKQALRENSLVAQVSRYLQQRWEEGSVNGAHMHESISGHLEALGALQVSVERDGRVTVVHYAIADRPHPLRVCCVFERVRVDVELWTGFYFVY